MKIQGTVVKYGDGIDTDVIIPGKYTKTLIMDELAVHAMEDLDPDFHNKIKNSPILVAGKNFGCGSSREQAVLALLHAGVRCVIAKSFARIFFRNAINVGLPSIVADTDRIEEGDFIEYQVGDAVIRNVNKAEMIDVAPMPSIMGDILTSGGLAKYLLKNKGYNQATKRGMNDE